MRQTQGVVFGGLGPSGNAAVRGSRSSRQGRRVRRGGRARGSGPCFERQARELDRPQARGAAPPDPAGAGTIKASSRRSGRTASSVASGRGSQNQRLPSSPSTRILPPYEDVRSQAVNRLFRGDTMNYTRISADLPHRHALDPARSLLPAMPGGHPRSHAVCHRRAGRAALDVEERRLVSGSWAASAVGHEVRPGEHYRGTRWPRRDSTMTARRASGAPPIRTCASRTLERDGVQAEIIFGILGAATRLDDHERPPKCSASTTTGSSISAPLPTARSALPACPTATSRRRWPEIHRVAKRAARLELSCSWDMDPMWHPSVEPLWQAVNEVGLPLHFHTSRPCRERAGKGDWPHEARRALHAVSGFQMNLINILAASSAAPSSSATRGSASPSARAASAGSLRPRPDGFRSGRTASAISAHDEAQ